MKLKKDFSFSWLLAHRCTINYWSAHFLIASRSFVYNILKLILKRWYLRTPQKVIFWNDLRSCKLPPVSCQMFELKIRKWEKLVLTFLTKSIEIVLQNLAKKCNLFTVIIMDKILTLFSQENVFFFWQNYFIMLLSNVNDCCTQARRS